MNVEKGKENCFMRASLPRFCSDGTELYLRGVKYSVFWIDIALLSILSKQKDPRK